MFARPIYVASESSSEFDYFKQPVGMYYWGRFREGQYLGGSGSFMAGVDRREFLLSGAAALTASSKSLNAEGIGVVPVQQTNATHVDGVQAEPPALKFVMRVSVEVSAPMELGEIAGVKKRIIPITGGSFEGPGIKGKVLPFGADWQYTRPDGVAVLEARYTLQTDDGRLITVENRGFRHGVPGLAAMIASGKKVPRSQYYFVTAPVFEASDEGLAWLTKAICVGEAERQTNRVVVDVWQVGRDWKV